MDRYIQYFLQAFIDPMAWRSADSAYLICVVLTCVQVPMVGLTSQYKTNDVIFFVLKSICVLYCLFCRLMHYQKPWKCKNQPIARVILLCAAFYCTMFPAKPFYGSHRLDLVVIRPLGIDHGAFVVSPDSVWYARVLLLFSASAMTDTGCHWLQVLRLCPRVNSGNKR
jgi:hypothetical protein